MPSQDQWANIDTETTAFPGQLCTGHGQRVGGHAPVYQVLHQAALQVRLSPAGGNPDEPGTVGHGEPVAAGWSVLTEKSVDLRRWLQYGREVAREGFPQRINDRFGWLVPEFQVAWDIAAGPPEFSHEWLSCPGHGFHRTGAFVKP